ncbi:MAG: hypothetical protein IJT46_00885 [Bacteroidaceae bacterium]|nr:hypothetical protein [Bacteroidaceae bacterium]MBQ8008233.1 hypothetical protein [Bacteroidaceae bacterium]
MRNETVLVCFMLLFIAWVPMVHAQYETEEIREHYYKVKQRIAEMEQQAIPAEYYQVTIMKNLPGSGPHKETVNMYYTDREDHEIWPSHCLELVTSSYNYAVWKFYEEYLYRPNGYLAFIYVRTQDNFETNTEYEFRFYFKDGLQRVIVKQREQGNGEFTTAYDGDEIPQPYLPYYYQYLNSANKYRHMFSVIDLASRE